METKKLYFDIDASTIDIKPLLRKDFLELSMKAISSANPNRNNSWFTRESMEKSIDTFRNKPILGYFENGDFVSHNGEWTSDSETQMEYWDTLGKKGERILGLIRSEDEVKIVEDKNGLSWICLSCALWTQYSFKQVKRLLKDAKRAKQTGEATKNVSVEVDITDYEMLENGVMKINAFNLIGITILGSRNGVKVEPGIEDAELSVVDIMGRELYERQANSIRLAYERLDNKVQKEEFSQMDNELKTENIEQPVVPENSDVIVNDVIVEEPKEENIVIEEAESTEPVSEEPKAEEVIMEEKTESIENVETDNSVNDSENVPEESTVIVEEKTEEINEHLEENNDCHCEEHDENPDEEEKDDEDEDEDEEEIEEPKEEEHEEEEICPGCGKNPCECEKHTCEEQVDSVDSIEVINWEEKYGILEQEFNTLKEQYENVVKDLSIYKKAEFLSHAKELLIQSKITEKAVEDFYTACEQDEITNLDDLKVKVALYMLDKTIKIEEVGFETSAIITPDTKSAFETNKGKEAKKTNWSTLQEYIGK